MKNKEFITTETSEKIMGMANEILFATGDIKSICEKTDDISKIYKTTANATGETLNDTIDDIREECYKITKELEKLDKSNLHRVPVAQKGVNK